MKLSDISIKNPVFAWMLMIGLMVFGAISFTNLGVSQLPDVDFPVVSVAVNLEGAAPEVMESEVADILEDAAMTIPGVKEVSSSSRQGQTTVTIEFELDKDIDIAIQDVQTKVAQAQRRLPTDIDPPVITKTNPEDQPIMWVALSGNKPLPVMMAYARDQVKDQLTTVYGVGEVVLGGFVEPNVRVWLDNNQLIANELTVDDIITTIKEQHKEVPAGQIQNAKQELNVRIMGEALSIDAFKNIIISSRGGAPVWTPIRLGDVATIEDGLMDIRRISRSQKLPAIGFGIRKQRGVNAVKVATDVKTKIAEIQKNLPAGMALNIVFDSTKFIKESSHELNFTLILSALLTALVCWLMMGSWQSAFNIVLAIPVSILGTFIVMQFFGFTLNTFTLLGLSLVIGIVVDDAIMVLENIVRYREMGHSKVKAAILGTREITSAAVAASIAVLAIFVPVIFMKGIMGKFFFQFGITISVAVLLSLLEALTIAPMRSSQFLQISRESKFNKWMDSSMTNLSNGYRRVLGACLRWRWLVIILSIAIFAGSFTVVKSIPKEFVPPQDQGRFMVRIQTKMGSSLTFTDQVFKQLESRAMTLPGVKLYYSAIGGFGGGESNAGMMFITMKDPKERPLGKNKKPISQKELMGLLRKEFKKIPGVKRVAVQDLSLSGFSAQRGFPIEFTLRGPDWKTLGTVSETFKEKMDASGVMIDVDSDYLLGMPEIQIFPNRDAANARGVTIASIGRAIEATIGGVRAGKYLKEGKRNDIRVRLKGDQRSLPADIQAVFVRNNKGELIRLSELVTLVEKQTLMSITHKGRERAISIFANVGPGKSQQQALDKIKEMSTTILPDGYKIVFSGSAKTYKESGQSLMWALALGLVVAYMVLGAQFNSFIHPIVVLLSLPFSITGAFFALKLSGQSLNLYSMIGILLLMGLVKKNAILLVDFTNKRRNEGQSVTDALLEACPIRLRPIMLTSIATIAAAIPPALAIGPGAETRIPMAIVIIGGVSLSTLLTLFVIPCAYSLLSVFESKKQKAEVEKAFKELE